MFRELTYSDVSRSRAIADAEAAFVMDEEAFRGFYDRNARGIWAYLSRVTGDRQMADDLLQETFYRFLRASSAGEPDRFDSDAHRRNSLYRIATNLATDARRRSFTRPAAAISGDDVERLADAGGVGRFGSDHGADIGRRTDVNRALAQLRPRDRAMLWMAYAEGSSHDEIADVIGVQRSSMKLLLFRARRKMAKLLGAEGGAR